MVVVVYDDDDDGNDDDVQVQSEAEDGTKSAADESDDEPIVQKLKVGYRCNVICWLMAAINFGLEGMQSRADKTHIEHLTDTH